MNRKPLDPPWWMALPGLVIMGAVIGLMLGICLVG